jgi:hypothetical protein
VEVDTECFNGGASLLEDVVEDVEAVVGIRLVAILSVGPAGISAVIDVSYVFGKCVYGEARPICESPETTAPFGVCYYCNSVLTIKGACRL